MEVLRVKSESKGALLGVGSGLQREGPGFENLSEVGFSLVAVLGAAEGALTNNSN